MSSEENEYCTSASIKLVDGREYDGHRHDRCYAIMKESGLRPEVAYEAIQGFRTNIGRFVDRYEGMRLQRSSGRKSMYRDDGVLRGDMLFSEDLY